ncbi:MAG: HAMP domain-containing histidine kinase [Verrucomicrobiae bacterium]|nr:HAMP domain-containing histidine kinase [Verrucomicrobiae bacterium]
MINATPLEKLMPRTRRTLALGLGLALAVLALTILAGWFFVRGLVREQIAHRDAEALYATTLMEQLDAGNGLDEPLESGEQIGFEAAILASRLRGVLGIRFFNAKGEFTDAFPATIQPQPLAPGALRSVREFKPHSRFRTDTPMSDVFIYLPQFATGHVARVPMLEVAVPLHERDNQYLAGVAQFLVEGRSIATEYEALDRHLGGMAIGTFVAAGVVLVMMLWPAFRRVERLNHELAQRSERLQRANQELALAARASAVGAVSAHLMHGLKNPLASLSQFVRSHQNEEQQFLDPEWQDALTAARRMQSLVEQTIEVLADARGEPAYELTPSELVETVRARVESLRLRHDIRLAVAVDAKGRISSRTANLVSLILVNLVENAIQATPAGKTVALTLDRQNDYWNWRVQDQGAGFPVQQRAHLFLPCKSTREGGSGIGLAISKQIADHLGAKLELVDPAEGGCVFVLSVPVAAAAD